MVNPLDDLLERARGLAEALPTIALVPARVGSKGLPGKNLMTVGGLSLVARAVRLARSMPSLLDVVVSSDSEEILDEGARHGGSPVRRPDHLASDSASMGDVTDHLLETRSDAAAVIVLQPTSPLRNQEDVAACFLALERGPAAATVCVAQHPVEWYFTMGTNGALNPLGSWESVRPNRQETQPVFQLNGAVYAARSSHLAAGGSLVDSTTLGVPMPRSRSIDIDDEVDLEVARALISMEPGP